MAKLKETLELRVGKASEQVMLQYSKQDTIDKKELGSLIQACAKNLDINLSKEDVTTLENKYSQVVADTMNVKDIKPLVDSILNVIEDVNQKRQENEKAIKPGDVVSVPFGSKYLCGIVKAVTNEKITLDNYKNSEIEVPNNNKVYKFFPGQKFDMREFERVDDSTTEKLSLKEKLNKFLSKTDVGSFSNLVANHKGDLIQLLKGQMTNKLFNGQSLVQNPEGKQELKNWACKFQLYRGNDGNLKLNTAWKQEQLQTKVYGVELSPEQLKNTMEKKQSVVIERETKEGIPFKAFCKYDKDLNSFVTSQYDNKIAERMKASYSKKEEQAQSQKEAPEQKQTNKKGKGRSI